MRPQWVTHTRGATLARDCGAGRGLDRTNPKGLPGRIPSVSLIGASPAVGSPNLTPVAEALPEPCAALFDLVAVSASEMDKAVSFVPKPGYHVRAEFEDGQDRYLSFDAHFIRETDEATGDDVEYYDLYNLHLDGQPCTADDVDALFEGGLERLADWVWQQGEVD